MSDITGQRFGRLVAINRTEKHWNKWHWLCKCDCGNEKSIDIASLRYGLSKSCGCLRLELTAKRRTTHGHVRGRKQSPTYVSWQSMIGRTQRGLGKSPHIYFGMEIDPRWKSFKNFLADMGERPGGKTLDRRDGTKGYWKWNCRWATQIEQMSNMSKNVFHEVDGVKLTETAAARAIATKTECSFNSAYYYLRKSRAEEKSSNLST